VRLDAHQGLPYASLAGARAATMAERSNWARKRPLAGGTLDAHPTGMTTTSRHRIPRRLVLGATVGLLLASTVAGEAAVPLQVRAKKKRLRSKTQLLADLKELRARQASIRKVAGVLGAMAAESMPKGLPAADRKTWPKFKAFLARSAKQVEAKLATWKGKLRSMTKKVQAIAPNDTKALMAATRELQEMNMSFNLQYLQLQNKISHENRQFTMVSNIMKNKHDTAKNSINNIR
jgi:hypothetical protein